MSLQAGDRRLAADSGYGAFLPGKVTNGRADLFCSIGKVDQRVQAASRVGS
jgi:hypothetical protein